MKDTEEEKDINMKIIKYKDLNSLSKEELISHICNLQSELSSKKYGLIWDQERERERVVVECETNFPVLKHITNNDIYYQIFLFVFYDHIKYLHAHTNF